MRPFSQLLASTLLVATAALVPAASSASETIVYQDCQPETRAWVSGHYEWIGDTWGYVPGHWLITRQTCQTTEIDRVGETVVYVERPTTRVVYVDPPPCEPRVVYVEPACGERRHTRVEEPRRSHVDVQVTALPIPVPFPVPFPFFRHHH